MAQKRDTHEQPLWHVVVVELLFVAVGVAIIYFRDTAGAVAFRLPAGVELAIGLPAGAVTGLAVGLVLTRSRLRAGVMPMAAALRPVVASPVSIVLTGLLAGIGEELLFRAAFDIVLLALLAPFIKAAGVQRSPVPATAGMR